MTANESQILPDHILSAILTLAKRKGGGERFAFRGHDSTLQRVFREIQREGQFPTLSRFVFSNAGPVPYSPVLTDAVSKLQLSGLIGRENPDYEVVFLMPAAERFFDQILFPQLSANEKSELELVAVEFLKRVSAV